MSSNAGPLGPINQFLIDRVWTELFNASGPIYLPSIIQGKVSGSIQYDPYQTTGDTGAMPVGQSFPNACLKMPPPPILPIASGNATLDLGDPNGGPGMYITGLSAVSPGQQNPTFSATDPIVTTTLNFGTLPDGTTIPTNVTGAFHFAQGCCEPTSPGGPCGGDTWTSTGDGTFAASISQSVATVVILVNTSPKLSITTQSITFALAPGGIFAITLTTLDGAPAWVKAAAGAAASSAQAKQGILNNINTLLNGPDVLGALDNIVNQQLGNL
jgi:hypothetical protein